MVKYLIRRSKTKAMVLKKRMTESNPQLPLQKITPLLSVHTVQRSAKRYANLAKQDPGRGRQKKKEEKKQKIEGVKEKAKK